eukprot:gene10031-biopygen1273
MLAKHRRNAGETPRRGLQTRRQRGSPSGNALLPECRQVAGSMPAEHWQEDAGKTLARCRQDVREGVPRDAARRRLGAAAGPAPLPRQRPAGREQRRARDP